MCDEHLKDVEAALVGWGKSRRLAHGENKKRRTNCYSFFNLILDYPKKIITKEKKLMRFKKSQVKCLKRPQLRASVKSNSILQTGWAVWKYKIKNMFGIYLILKLISVHEIVINRSKTVEETFKF